MKRNVLGTSGDKVEATGGATAAFKVDLLAHEHTMVAANGWGSSNDINCHGNLKRCNTVTASHTCNIALELIRLHISQLYKSVPGQYY